MTVKIDRLSLRLPQGFESRAKEISKKVGAGLNRQSWNGELNLSCLRLPPISVSRGEGDSAIAQKVVCAIMQEIEGRRN